MIKAIALLTPIYVTSFWAFVFLLQKGKQSRPKLHLGFFMILALFLYSSHAVFFSKLYNIYSYLESVYLFTMLSIYPLYYIYILLRTTEDAGFKSQFKHFIPAIIFSFLSLLFTFFLSHEQRVSYIHDILINKNLSELQFSSMVGIKGYVFFTSRFIFLLQVLYYSFKGVKEVNTHNKKVANYYSNIEGKTLNWIKNLNIVILFVAASNIIFTIIGKGYFMRHEVSLLIPSFIFSAVLFVIGFKGNQQSEVLEKINEEDEDVEAAFEDIKTENGGKLKIRLIEQFEVKNIYMNPDLRITNVSENLGTNRTYISRLINDEFGINFNEFVNNYRINEAKQLLCGKENSRYKMEHIAEKSGFGSVASFSRVFKELEGITPGQYRKYQNNTIQKNI